ncbi:uncharacterized protein L969DRAFT_19153 [Mixia osmundae IAM 14324]|uniref:Dienelactone hydrolase domain-containing protein n=1 Tax=Mixia osmundae (strain CBS 9802 / IAM 14324 / JCM 22182 / KY 12970) TaxID=764103 RepID=G7E4P7_MIXOS|nr:uncharacterized protein L969DRAFT_19153 [Mixia osmundae IAM 14324]KEI37675.1 hypothetical protein L969DRAFT_19153 [Mixia osmundae IAM 14324]GAA97807.1 hypothetical protein E5Q_04486 [Mixia osmundae IAM 14324]
MSCADCFKGYMLDGEPRGSMVDIGGVQAYSTLPAKGDAKAGTAIVIATDIFGLAVKNPKLLADRFSDVLGVAAYVPDLFEGDFPGVNVKLIEKPISKESMLTKIVANGKMITSFMTEIGPRWVMRHSQGKLTPIHTRFLKALRADKGISKIGEVGYCYGGVQSITMAGMDPPLIDVAVAAHPGNTSKDMFEKIRVPILFVAAEEDMTFGEPVQKMAKEVLAANKVPAQFERYMGCCHGFAARPNLADKEIKVAFEAANEAIAAFFQKHLT